jgi:putative hydrolase of the HAD superfamily
MLQNIDRIRNIVFDLGGVILDIDVNRGIEAVRKLGVHHFDNLHGRYSLTDTLNDFEKGLISEEEFVSRFKKETDEEFSDEELIAAWNEIVQDFPKEKIELVDRLNRSSRFRTFLLSNTNATHKKAYTHTLREKFSIDKLEDLFEKAYFSHEIHMRKPDEEIFHYVLKDADMKPEETLFIDDSEANIETARKLGIVTYHLVDGITINDLFPEQTVARWI